ncbi:helix-turn-helix transcriptional regulator [Alicyclobacillus sp. ALC3]|uniref:helix-turn-helix transcriptional regulator n=1 Tax=Alicyclobacillus sp. ALC3 TaxID=2796143 RepID=UPI002378E664|nr:helix-turn-helix transcriptional regulator [Alicyclobacillus sp. ALC3]WDL98788.1 helix-turn-helix domain-containing protein [Alicyclobacillus sp. ALC3]
MSDSSRHQSLSDFLRTHRAKLQPDSVGLPVGKRRRTPGLRREEVAQLAGVSTTWYTWLEQGRDISVSAQVLDSIASALRFNDDERRYLYVLATGHTEHVAINPAPPTISPAVRLIIDQLEHYPTIVSDRRCNVVAWNQAAAEVFIDFGKVPAEERNIIWLLFTRKEFKALASNWTDFIRGFVAMFRSYYGQYIGDPWYNEFIEMIQSRNSEFLTFWNHNEVNAAPDVSIEFRHARAGKMLFDLTSLQLQGSHDLRCSIYTPSVGSDTEEKIVHLIHG